VGGGAEFWIEGLIISCNKFQVAFPISGSFLSWINVFQIPELQNFIGRVSVQHVLIHGFYFLMKIPNFFLTTADVLFVTYTFPLTFTLLSPLFLWSSFYLKCACPHIKVLLNFQGWAHVTLLWRYSAFPAEDSFSSQDTWSTVASLGSTSKGTVKVLLPFTFLLNGIY
jgi:hypothetical protein